MGKYNVPKLFAILLHSCFYSVSKPENGFRFQRRGAGNRCILVPISGKCAKIAIFGNWHRFLENLMDQGGIEHPPPKSAVWIFNFGFGILDFEFWIWDLGFWISDFEFWIWDFGFAVFAQVWILHKIYQTHADSGRRIYTACSVDGATCHVETAFISGRIFPAMAQKVGILCCAAFVS